MFAVIHKGGRQHKVAKGDVIEVNRLEDEEGSTIEIENVLLVSDGKNVQIGEPTLDGLKLKAKVLKHKRGDKVLVFKMKPKKRYQKTRGHRQELTELEILEIPGEKAKGESKATSTKKPATKKTTAASEKKSSKKSTPKKSE